MLNCNCDIRARAPGQRFDAVDGTLNFPHGLVEIRRFNWGEADREAERLRPQMYVFELPLQRTREPAAPARAMHGDTVKLMSPGRRVPCDIPLGEHRSLLCLFEAAWIEALAPGGVIFDFDETRPIPLGDAVRFEWLLGNIYQELRQENFGRAIMIEAMANALAVELVRRGRMLAPEDRTAFKGGMAPWRMRLLEDRVQSDSAMPSLAELAELCGLTVRHLCRAFKAETGRTPGEYVRAAMVRHAQWMLNETTLPLGEIARQLGFATSSSFALAFQRATGMKPRDVERPAISRR